MRTLMTLKNYFSLGICCACLLVGCKDDEMVTEQHKPEIEYANKVPKQINENIVSLRKLANAAQLGLSVTSCTPYEDKSGFYVLFSNGLKVELATKQIQIKEDSEGSTEILLSPIVGIGKSEDSYFWTLDGTWLPLGQPAESPYWIVGNQSPTPVIDFTKDGHWQLSCGDSITVLELVKSGVINSYFSEVAFTSNGNYEFSFSDGTSLSFPVTGAASEPDPITGRIRRPISPQQPMWLIHIDTWLEPDPQKIIDMVPKDILPYVVFNISLSVDGDRATGEWRRVKYGYETAKSWLRTCAENNVWAMIQPSSGAYCHFPDIYNYEEMKESLYAEFYKEYPNFIGFNYCEQFWGFQSADNPHTVTFQQRLAHWVHLMNLTHEYGGYLIISCTGPYYGASMNPVGMFKQDANLAEVCASYPENFILCEKFTSKYGFHNTESASMGAWLSGYAGQYGIRFDITGWNGLTESEECPVPSGTIPVIEHMALTGQTIIDGPELIPTQCYKEVSAVSTTDGYTTRKWEHFPQFENISIDLFRKILDGTLRILEKKEVIERTKLMLIHDVNSGNDREKYTSPHDLYEGLYQMDDDGNMLNNRSWFKKTGRYPAIPYAYALNGEEANAFEQKMNLSQYASTWSTIESKVAAMNKLFPEEYQGDMYAARSENTWVTYNPFKTGQKATAIIPFKYNTCQQMELSYSLYSLGLIREYANHVTFYLSNYDNSDTSLKTDVIQIVGATSEPTYSLVERGSHSGSRVSKTWNNHLFTLEVTHNGPLDLTIYCAGGATVREREYQMGQLSTPSQPEIYKGIHQYEAENFDYKNIDRIQKNAYQQPITDYTALGYLEFGTRSSAAVRSEVSVLKEGAYSLQIKYMALEADITTVDLYVNGTKIASPIFSKTGDKWDVIVEAIGLRKGANALEFKANRTGAGAFYLDNITIKAL